MEIELIVRGICCLIPGVGRVYKKTVRVISIVGRFSGTFQNLHIWKRRKTENLYSICRLDDRNTVHRVEVAGTGGESGSEAASERDVYHDAQ